MGVFIGGGGGKSLLWPKVGLGGPTCKAGWPARVAKQSSFIAALSLGIGYPIHRPSLTHWQTKI
jgi:hypothetical protein